MVKIHGPFHGICHPRDNQNCLYLFWWAIFIKYFYAILKIICFFNRNQVRFMLSCRMEAILTVTLGTNMGLIPWNGPYTDLILRVYLLSFQVSLFGGSRKWNVSPGRLPEVRYAPRNGPLRKLLSLWMPEKPKTGSGDSWKNMWTAWNL